MMKLMNKKTCLAWAVLLCGSTASAAYLQDADLALLDSLDRGLWQLRAVGGGPTSAANTQICVADPARLTQVQHGDASCTRYVVRNTPNSITVSYSCKGQGQGLTTIRKETNKLIHIQSQGIRNNSPFSFSVEGRRLSAC